jgi:beta-glucosidase
MQAKSKSVQVVLGPNINLHRDPRSGRNFEAFSEDPLVTAQLAAAIVNGIQSQGVGACVKHFVANESETVRRRYNVDESGDSRTMREIYLRAFQLLLRKAKPVSIMTACVSCAPYLSGLSNSLES